MSHSSADSKPGRRLLSRMLAISGLMSLLLIPALALAQTPQQVSISLKEFMLSPDKVTVTQGQPLQFTITNNGTIEHNFKVEMPKQSIEQTLFATNLMPGETRTAQYTFPVAGDWEMYCPVDMHEAHGMKGELQVLSAAPGGMPATGAPDTLGLWLTALLGVVLLATGLLTGFRQKFR